MKTGFHSRLHASVVQFSANACPRAVSLNGGEGLAAAITQVCALVQRVGERSVACKINFLRSTVAVLRAWWRRSKFPSCEEMRKRGERRVGLESGWYIYTGGRVIEWFECVVRFENKLVCGVLVWKERGKVNNRSNWWLFLFLMEVTLWF